jgi:hypothetical protein
MEKKLSLTKYPQISLLIKYMIQMVMLLIGLRSDGLSLLKLERPE